MNIEDIFDINNLIGSKKVTNTFRGTDWFILSRLVSSSPRVFESVAITKDNFISEIASLIPTPTPVLPYKARYEALLTQTTTSAPVATILSNNMSGDIVWSYSAVGQYIGTLTGAFPAGKTAIELVKYNPVTLAFEVETYAARIDNDSVLVTTYNLDFDPFGGTPVKTLTDNGGLTNSFIRITAYN